jgi:hypothetical protein
LGSIREKWGCKSREELIEENSISMQDVSMQDDSVIAKSDEEIKYMLDKELSPEQENKKKERNEFYNNIMPHRQSLKNPLNE